MLFFFFRQKTAYDMRISDWSSDVCSSDLIRARGAELGFTFDMDRRRHVWNTFDAHRLLHWAGLESLQAQRALKHALLRAYFTDGENVSEHDVLARRAESAGLAGGRARQVLASGEFVGAVSGRARARERP